MRRQSRIVCAGCEQVNTIGGRESTHTYSRTLLRGEVLVFYAAPLKNNYEDSPIVISIDGAPDHYNRDVLAGEGCWHPWLQVSKSREMGPGGILQCCRRAKRQHRGVANQTRPRNDGRYRP